MDVRDQNIIRKDDAPNREMNITGLQDDVKNFGMNLKDGKMEVSKAGVSRDNHSVVSVILRDV